MSNRKCMTSQILVYTCSECDESSENALEMVGHFGKCHPPAPKQPKPRRTYECYICKCEFDCYVATNRHMKRHLKARDTRCEICGHRYTSTELQQWHICGTDGSQFNEISCEYCDESFESIVKCMQHLKSAHSNGRIMHQCRKCYSSKCYEMELLKNLHQKYYVHPKKPFECDICARKYSDKNQIKNHMRTHSNDRKHNSISEVFFNCFFNRM